MHKLSIVTIHYQCTDVLQGLLDSAQTLGPLPEVEWIIIDHSPAQPSLSERLKFPTNFGSVRVIEYPQKKGFGEGCNLGARNSDGQVVFFLNPDCRFQGGSLVGFADRVLSEKRIGALSPLLVTPQGRPEFSFARFPGLLSEARLRGERILSSRFEFYQKAVNRRFEKPRWVDWVTGGALFTPRDVFFGVGGFDDDFFLYFEDSDLCKRMKQAGYKVGFDPGFTLIHDHGHGGSTKVPRGKPKVYRLSQLRYYSKHKNALERMFLNAYLKASGRYPE
jgi:GT2 family glycosyltransferase